MPWDMANLAEADLLSTTILQPRPQKDHRWQQRNDLYCGTRRRSPAKPASPFWTNSLALKHPLSLGLQRGETGLPVATGKLPIQRLSLSEPASLSQILGAIPENLRVARLALEGGQKGT